MSIKQRPKSSIQGRRRFRFSAKERADAWKSLSRQDNSDSMAYRDVHTSQQIERGEIGDKRKPYIALVAGAMAGLILFMIIWLCWGFVGFIAHFASSSAGSGESAPSDEMVATASEFGVPNYWVEVSTPVANGTAHKTCFYEADPQGQPVNDDCKQSRVAVSVPQWYSDQSAAVFADHGLNAEGQTEKEANADSLGHWLFGHSSLLRWLVSLGGGVIGGAVLATALRRTIESQNVMHDTTDINQYKNDQHVALPEEVVSKYGIFPDIGAHSSVQPSSLLSHVMLTNKGLKSVDLTRHADKDIYEDDHGTRILATHKGAPLKDSGDRLQSDRRPMIDEAFGDALFDASGLPKDKNLRTRFHATDIPYNPGGKNIEKFGDADTVAQHINDDWTLPWYEPQRPAGAYIVDEAPVNTMVLAITRAGKGQTYIEPTIDMWLREKRYNNMVVNDPKGELLVEFYSRAARRGFSVVQFNLINALKTDIYNPLGLAAEAAREGDFNKCALYVENIAEVFFPVDGAEDPVWPNAANNAFKRTAYGMIDFYLEEERLLRKQAVRKNTDPKVLDNKIDDLWGKVTLYNCYQFFVQLSAKKRKNPIKDLEEKLKDKEWTNKEFHCDPESVDTSSAKYKDIREKAEGEAELWDGADELDEMTLFFNATDRMPVNSMRTLVLNADKSLRAMAGAEKMLSSVYAIALTAMSFFTDPTISSLTSGKLSQNVDLGSLSFPRRIGVRFNQNYVRRLKLVGARVLWDAYSDPKFEHRLGDDFTHEDTVSREGWARFYFKGIFESRTAYLRLRVVNADSKTLIKTFYFRFTKGYETSLNGRTLTTNPITGERTVKNGVLVELVKDGQRFKRAVSSFKDKRISIAAEADGTFDPKNVSTVETETPIVLQHSVRYAEKPKAIFLVTPPHLTKYAKLILILIKQLVDLNFDKSYMTKSNQKPLYKTRFMLDEVGNLQSEGHGIASLQTMLSIGLGQEQQFTLILQTLQQLRDIYGDSVDKIVQGNTSNIIFLKSTDDSMIETLEKMSGKTHRVYRESKSITQDMKRVAMRTEGKISYTMAAKEEPVITYNDMAYLPPRNSIVFRAGDPPIWNRNGSILPMSWRLFRNTIADPGSEFSLQTIPTQSSAKEFDVRMNQPNFTNMLTKRMRQARLSPQSMSMYRQAYGLSEDTVNRLDPDVYSNEVMDVVDKMEAHEAAGSRSAQSAVDEQRKSEDEAVRESFDGVNMEDNPAGQLPEGAMDAAVDLDDIDTSADGEFNQRQAAEQAESSVANDEIKTAVATEQNQQQQRDRKVFARGRIAKSDLVSPAGQPTGSYDAVIINAFVQAEDSLSGDARFTVSNHQWMLATDGTVIIDSSGKDSDEQTINAARTSDESRVYAEDDVVLPESSGLKLTSQGVKWLASLEDWSSMEAFDTAAANLVDAKANETLATEG